MFRRKITEEIFKWKNSTGKKKALVIKGMRQIGKTYIVQDFANENYENVVYGHGGQGISISTDILTRRNLSIRNCSHL